VQKAQIDLSFTKITPHQRHRRYCQSQLGDLVGKPGGPELTTVSTVDPLVYCPISEQEYMRFSRGAIKGEIQVIKGSTWS